MPILLEPEQKYPIVLDRDESLDEQTRPTFFASAMSARQSFDIRKVIHSFSDDEQGFDLLQTLVIDWRNVKDEDFSPDKLLDVLTTTEGWELLRKIVANDHVTASEKKSTESLRSLGEGNSVNNAHPVDALV